MSGQRKSGVGTGVGAACEEALPVDQGRLDGLAQRDGDGGKLADPGEMLEM